MLELLAAEPHGLNLQEIARRLERSPNEPFRMLDVLVGRGFPARQPDAREQLRQTAQAISKSLGWLGPKQTGEARKKRQDERKKD